MTSGVTLYSWNGRPALESQDGRVRYIASPGTDWTGHTEATAVAVATLRAQAITIGRDEFDARFGGPPWNVPDLDGWFIGRGSTAPYDIYAKARAWARG